MFAARRTGISEAQRYFSVELGFASSPALMYRYSASMFVAGEGSNAICRSTNSGSARMGEPVLTLAFRHEVQVDKIELESTHDVFQVGFNRVDQVRWAPSHQQIDVGVEPEASGFERTDQRGVCAPRANG